GQAHVLSRNGVGAKAPLNNQIIPRRRRLRRERDGGHFRRIEKTRIGERRHRQFNPRRGRVRGGLGKQHGPVRTRRLHQLHGTSERRIGRAGFLPPPPLSFSP